MNPTSFFPLGDRLMVQVVEPASSKSSVIIQVSGGHDRTVNAIVLDIGPDVNAIKASSTVVSPLPTEQADLINPGDTVIFCREHGVPVKIDGQEFVFVRREHVIASTCGAE